MGKIDCRIFLLTDALKKSLKIKEKSAIFLNSNNNKGGFFLLISW